MQLDAQARGGGVPPAAAAVRGRRVRVREGLARSLSLSSPLSFLLSLPSALPRPSPAGSGWERVCGTLRCKVCVRGGEGGKDSRGSRGCPVPALCELPRAAGWR